MSEFTCDRQALHTLLSLVATVVPSRTTRDILKNIHISATPNSLTAFATDTELAISSVLTPIDGDVTFEMLLPSSRILKILSEAQSETITMRSHDGVTHVTCGGGKFKLQQEDAKEFPGTCFSGKDETGYRMNGQELRKAIKRTVYAADNESTRYALGGVVFDINDTSITLAATDSRRLSVYSTICQRDKDSPKKINPVVHKKAIGVIDRIIGGYSGEVVLQITANDIWVSVGDSQVYSRLVEGRFPNYRDVIPKDAVHIIDFVASAFHAAVRQSMIVTNNESRGVDFRFTNGEVTLSSKAAEVGQSDVTVPVSFADIDDERPVVMMDPQYVADFLKSLNPEDPVTLHLTSQNEPVLFTSGDNYKHVIMPLARD